MNDIHPRTVERFGWIPDRPDSRDLMVEALPTTTLTELSLRTDPAMPPIWDQGQLGSCTAHGTGRCYAFARAKHLGEIPTQPSRLFIYYFERWLEGSVKSDSGACVRDGFKVLSTMGVPDEAEWPYNTAEFAVKPPSSSITDAKKHEVLQYTRLASGCPSITHLKNSLALGLPVTFGFTVFESFMSIGADGIMSMPAKGESVDGGHCVAAVGFNDETRLVEIANSWGPSWGNQGFFFMPYDYISSKYCNDFWQAKVAV